MLNPKLLFYFDAVGHARLIRWSRPRLLIRAVHRLHLAFALEIAAAVDGDLVGGGGGVGVLARERERIVVGV